MEAWQRLLRRPEVLWLLAAAAVLVLALAWAGSVAAGAYQRAAADIATITPRYARLAGMLQNSSAFTQDEAALGTNLEQFIYPAATDPGQIATAALQRVRELATRHDLSVTSSQTATPREQDGFTRIGLTLRVEGTWPDTVALLGDLTQERPLLYYSTLQINGRGAGNQPGVAPLILSQLDLYALQERAP